ncbi:MAG: DUF1641 domain-containing protein [Trueperaceae bacterium]|nr:DUF1641 domain-containing protein [Trueperaceae bacterium]
MGVLDASRVERPPLQKRLQEAQTEEVLHRLLDRLDGIERSLEQLSMLNQEAPAFTATVADTVDSMVQRLHGQGIDINERLENSLVLLEKLTTSETSSVLNQVLSRMDKLEQALALLDSLPNTLAAMGDTADDLVGRMQRSGINVNERAQGALGLLEKLTEPKTLAALNQMVTKLDSLGPLIELAEQVPSLAAIAMDSVDGLMEKVRQSGFDMNGTANALMHLAANLGPEQIKALSSLIKPEVLEQLLAMTTALEATEQQPIKQVGPMNMLGEMRDPDVQRALGFFLAFAKQFGQELKR